MILADSHEFNSSSVPWRPQLPTGMLGLFLVVDQLLLPMFHIGGLPFKISYFICALWLVDRLVTGSRSASADKDTATVACALGVIVACALLGELLLSSFYSVPDHGQAIRSIIIYILVGLAFGLGRSSARFRLQGLVPILLAAIALNCAFIFLKGGLPDWLIDLYYPKHAVSNLAAFGVTGAADILEMARPRGLFGNPNVSALMVNIIALFILLTLRLGLVAVPSPSIVVAIAAAPFALSVLLASRGEMIVSLVIGCMTLLLCLRKGSHGQRARLLGYSALLPFLAVFGLLRVVDAGSIQGSIQRVVSVVEVLSRAKDASSESRSLDSVARPLLTFQRMYDRVRISPVFGTGFSATAGRPYAAGTEHFHNDWFRLLATSGLLGMVAMIWLIARIAWPMGWPTLIPFVLPGLVNTFQLNIPAFMFFFFMLGVLRAALHARTHPKHAHDGSQ